MNLGHIKFTSEEDEFSVDAIEKKLFNNKFNNDNFDAKLLTDRQRGSFIQMLKLQTPRS